MKGLRTATAARGTPKGLIRAAEMRARMAARRRRSAGQDDDTIRQEVLARFHEFLDAESCGEYSDETIMAAAQRAVEAVLRESSARRSDC